MLLVGAVAAGARPTLDERYRLERLEKGIDVTYANLGRRHTPFRPELLRGTTPATADYLTHLVYFLDLLVVLRADAVTTLESGRPPHQWFGVEPVVRVRLEGLAPPPALAPVQKLLLQALADQEAFFHDWAHRPGTPLDLEAAAVRRGHERLVRAYDTLIAALGPQEAVVLEGLYDPFHAFDFLGVTPP